MDVARGMATYPWSTSGFRPSRGVPRPSLRGNISSIGSAFTTPGGKAVEMGALPIKLLPKLILSGCGKDQGRPGECGE